MAKVGDPDTRLSSEVHNENIATTLRVIMDVLKV